MANNKSATLNLEGFDDEVKDVKNAEQVTPTVENYPVNDLDENPGNEVDLTLDESAMPRQRKVKVATKENHRCHIGGEWFQFIKGKEQMVPPHVKEILKKAGLLEAV